MSSAGTSLAGRRAQALKLMTDLLPLVQTHPDPEYNRT
jgi:hypothetical protein